MLVGFMVMIPKELCIQHVFRLFVSSQFVSPASTLADSTKNALIALHLLPIGLVIWREVAGETRPFRPKQLPKSSSFFLDSRLDALIRYYCYYSTHTHKQSTALLRRRLWALQRKGGRIGCYFMIFYLISFRWFRYSSLPPKACAAKPSPLRLLLLFNL